MNNLSFNKVYKQLQQVEKETEDLDEKDKTRYDQLSRLMVELKEQLLTCFFKCIVEDYLNSEEKN